MSCRGLDELLAECEEESPKQAVEIVSGTSGKSVCANTAPVASWFESDTLEGDVQSIRDDNDTCLKDEQGLAVDCLQNPKHRNAKRKMSRMRRMTRESTAGMVPSLSSDCTIGHAKVSHVASHRHCAEEWLGKQTPAELKSHSQPYVTKSRHKSRSKIPSEPISQALEHVAIHQRSSSCPEETRSNRPPEEHVPVCAVSVHPLCSVERDAAAAIFSTTGEVIATAGSFRRKGISRSKSKMANKVNKPFLLPEQATASTGENCFLRSDHDTRSIGARSTSRTSNTSGTSQIVPSKCKANKPFLLAEPSSGIGAGYAGITNLLHDVGCAGSHVNQLIMEHSGPMSAAVRDADVEGHAPDRSSWFAEPGDKFRSCLDDDVAESCTAAIEITASAPVSRRRSKIRSNKMHTPKVISAVSEPAVDKCVSQSAMNARPGTIRNMSQDPVHMQKDISMAAVRCETAPPPVSLALSLVKNVDAEQNAHLPDRSLELGAVEASGNLGSMLQEMAVAVARLDAASFATTCKYPEQSQTVAEEMTVMRKPPQDLPCRHDVRSACLTRSSGESEIEELEKLEELEVVRQKRQKRRAARQQANPKDGLGRPPRESRRTSRSSAASSASASAMSKRTVCSTACPSTATSIASEASGSEVISEDDRTSRANSRRSEPSFRSQRAGVLQNFLAAQQEAASDVCLRRHLSALGVKAGPSKEHFPSRTPKVPEGVVGSSSLSSKLSPPALTHRSASTPSLGDTRHTKPPLPPPPVAAATECALCGGPCGDVSPGSCFCSACAARLQVLGSPVATTEAASTAAEPLVTKKASHCVLCNSGFVCTADAPSSVLCPSCLGIPSAIPA